MKDKSKIIKNFRSKVKNSKIIINFILAMTIRKLQTQNTMN